MKMTRYILPIAIASLTMAANTVRADLAEDNGRSHKLTVSLKAYYEGATKENEKNNGDVKFSQKILSHKISNKEILEGLVSEGIIASIKGWSIILVTDDDADIVGVFIEKKNNFPINVSQYFEVGAESEIEAYKGKYTAKKDMTTGTSESKAIGGVMIDIDDVEVEARGILKVRTEFSEDNDLGTDEEFIKDAQFTDLTGVLSEDDDDEGLVTGTVKVAKGKKFTYNRPG